MTTGDVEVLGTDDAPRSRRPLPVLGIGVLIAGVVAALLTRGGGHGTAAPAPPAPAPAPTGPLVSAAPADLPAGSVGRVGDIAVVLGHTAHTPSYGTVTTLDGPSAFSPVTKEIGDGIAVGVTGTGTTAWLAVVHTVRDDAGPASLESVDLQCCSAPTGAALPSLPHSIAAAAGRIWIGLDGRVAEWDPDARRLTLHRVAPGAVVDLVADPSGQHLYGAQRDGSSIVRWRLPGLVDEAERTVPGGRHITHLADGLGSIWASAVDDHRNGRVLRIAPDTLADEDAGPLARETAVQAVYAGTGEMWVLSPSLHRLRCLRAAGAGVHLGKPIALQPLEPADDATDLLVAVKDRVYVQVENGPATYVASVSCPAT